MAIKQFRNGSDVFGDSLVGLQFASTNGTPLFSFGDFSITTNIATSQGMLPMAGHPLVYNYQTNGYNTNLNIFINFNYSDITNYANYGSLTERLRSAVNGIITDFPAGIYYNQILYGLTYDSFTNITQFQIPIAFIYNPYNITLTSDGLLETSVSGGTLRNLVKYYNKFVLDYNNEETPLVNLTSDDNYLTISVNGNIFSATTANFLIKPNYLERENVFKAFDEIQQFLLNRDSTPLYTATFKYRRYLDDTLVDDTTSITWETYFYGYNPNINTNYLEQYINTLVGIGNDIDEIKSNLIARFYISDSIIDFDTPDQKIQKMLQVYGRSFDEIKKYIDGLAFANTVTYDKKNNAADNLIKNLAETIGWKADTIYSSDDLLVNVFGTNTPQVLTNTKNKTPYELDIEFWRRLFLNSAYLFKSKGTRKALEFILEYIGAPESLYEMNEYVYLADGKISINELESVISLTEVQTGTIIDTTTIPVDTEGYPFILNNSDTFYYQMPTYQQYFEKFPGLNYGFELTQEIDNKKVWFVSGVTDVVRADYADESYANYETNDERLILNNKFIDLNLKLSKPIENDVYNYYYTTLSGNTWFSQWLNQTPQGLQHFLDETYSRLINVRNRKGISQYPTLYKVYEEYLNASGTTGFRYIHVLKYLDSIGNYWTNVIKQFVPATTIAFVGEKITNTKFQTQKYVYKRGIDEGSVFTSNNVSDNLI
jgi:hypothetical protein